MLRLSRDRLIVSLAPAEVALVRVRSRLRPRLITRSLASCDPQLGREPWGGAVAALQDAAEDLRMEPLAVSIVLSNDFVRYASIPRNDALDDADEERAYAQHCFARVYGERARSWTLRIAEARAGAARLASAIDSALLDAIHTCFPKSAKARLVSVQPYLASAIDCWRAQIPASGAWLLLLERARACLALHAEGRWQTVRNAKGHFEGVDDWAALLEHERMRADCAVPGTVLVSALDASAVPPKMTNAGVHRLSPPMPEGFEPLEDGRYTLALTAA